MLGEEYQDVGDCGEVWHPCPDIHSADIYWHLLTSTPTVFLCSCSGIRCVLSSIQRHYKPEPDWLTDWDLSLRLRGLHRVSLSALLPHTASLDGFGPPPPISSPALTRYDTFWPALTCFDPFWPILTSFHPFSPVLAHFHPFYPFLQIFIGISDTIRRRWEIQCLLYAGFLELTYGCNVKN